MDVWRNGEVNDPASSRRDDDRKQRWQQQREEVATAPRWSRTTHFLFHVNCDLCSVKICWNNVKWKGSARSRKRYITYQLAGRQLDMDIGQTYVYLTDQPCRCIDLALQMQYPSIAVWPLYKFRRPTKWISTILEKKIFRHVYMYISS